MLKNKKIFYIFLSIFGFILIFSCDVFATFSVENNDIEVLLPDLPAELKTYYIIGNKNHNFESMEYTNDFYILTFDIEPVFDTSSSGSTYYNIHEPDLNSFTLYRFSLSNDSWVLADTKTISGAGRSNEFYHPNNFWYSNFDIVNSNGDLLFQAPPQQGEGILAPVMNQVEMSQTLLEIVNLLPLIIAVVVSFLGLRKGLRMLFRVLRAC